MLDQDNRHDPGYHAFKQKLDTLMRDRIPRQFHHLSLKELAAVTVESVR